MQYLIAATCFWFIHCQATDCYNCYRGNCYFVGPASFYDDAVQYCESKGGILTSISSAFENQFVAEVCPAGTCWIGLTDEAVEGRWKWLDGSPFTYSRWVAHQASQSRSKNAREDYVYIRRDGRWEDHVKNSYIHPLCKRIPTYQPTGIPTPFQTKKPTGTPTWSPTNQPTGVPTCSPIPQPTISPTRCAVWTEKVAGENCDAKFSSKTFGAKACRSSHQKRLELSLANELYGTCRSKCIYDYDMMKANRLGAYILYTDKSCYKYVKKGECFKKRKIAKVMRQIFSRRLKKDEC